MAYKSSTFGERLRFLRKERNLTLNDVAKDFAISKQAISFYERGLRNPDLGILIQLANYFSVSTDYLLGCTETRASIEQLERNLRNRIARSIAAKRKRMKSCVR